MWKPDDDFWLEMTKNDTSALQVALGIKPLRITASDSETDESRKGHIDVLIVSFDRKSHVLNCNIIENETTHRFSSRQLVLTVDERCDTETCRIRKIEGIIF